ncbi:site-specific integrase [Castellaniella sp.]|uniref:tyrosine-type recombinase/integrase n=1 Tax=Castellaniella sp. TaxID=1955812 RepID=UPI002AFE19A3|nr:site-specific integrase [Castellaniella sp.]
MPEFSLGKLNGRFVVTWREGGKRRRYRLDALNREDADRALEAFRRQHNVLAADTVSQLWDAYCVEKEGKAVLETMKYTWRALSPNFGHLSPQEITTQVCKAHIEARSGAGIKPGTIWTELGHLRTVLVWAEKSGLIARAPYIVRPAKPLPKDIHITRSEANRLLEAAVMPHTRLAILMMLTTAARVGAILDLTWDRVDFERGLIRLTIDDGVTRKGRATLPMASSLRAALEQARSEALTNHVIEWAGKPVESLRTGFSAAAKAAGLPHVTPHVLRHTAAVWMAEGGRSMPEIAQYLGHRNSRVTESVYARYSPNHLREAADILDFVKPTQVRRNL